MYFVACLVLLIQFRIHNQLTACKYYTPLQSPIPSVANLPSSRSYCSLAFSKEILEIWTKKPKLSFLERVWQLARDKEMSPAVQHEFILSIKNNLYLCPSSSPDYHPGHNRALRLILSPARSSHSSRRLLACSNPSLRTAFLLTPPIACPPSSP